MLAETPVRAFRLEAIPASVLFVSEIVAATADMLVSRVNVVALVSHVPKSTEIDPVANSCVGEV